MIELWVTGLIAIVTDFVTAFFTYFFTRKKYKVEVKGDEINNFDAAITAYKKMYDDIVNDLKTQIVDLKEENRELSKRLQDTSQQVITLTNFVLANAIKRADGELTIEDVNKLKGML